MAYQQAQVLHLRCVEVLCRLWSPQLSLPSLHIVLFCTVMLCKVLAGKNTMPTPGTGCANQTVFDAAVHLYSRMPSSAEVSVMQPHWALERSGFQGKVGTACTNQAVC